MFKIIICKLFLSFIVYLITAVLFFTLKMDSDVEIIETSEPGPSAPRAQKSFHMYGKKPSQLCQMKKMKLLHVQKQRLKRTSEIELIEYNSFPAIKKVLEQSGNIMMDLSILPLLTKELEKCLTFIIMRNRTLNSLIDSRIPTSIDKTFFKLNLNENDSDRNYNQDSDNSSKSSNDTVSKKRKPDAVEHKKSIKELSKLKERSYRHLMNDFDSQDGSKSETDSNDTYKLNLAKSVQEAPNKFWSMVQQYSKPVTKETIDIVEELLKEANRDCEDRSIPDLGVFPSHLIKRSRTCKQPEESSDSEEKEKNKSTRSELHNKSLHTTRKKKQKKAKTLIHKVMNNKIDKVDIFNESLYMHNDDCFTTKVRNIPVDSLFLNDKIHEKDEILEELLQCKAELKKVATENTLFLTELLEKIKYESKKQELEKKLHEIDEQILESERKYKMKKKKNMDVDPEKKEIWQLMIERQKLVRRIANRKYVPK